MDLSAMEHPSPSRDAFNDTLSPFASARMTLSQSITNKITQAERQVFQGRQRLIDIPGFQYPPPPEPKSGRDEHESEVFGGLQFLSGRGNKLFVVTGQFHSVTSIEQSQYDHVQENFRRRVHWEMKRVSNGFLLRGL
jgi:hypothetical protein